MQIRRMAIRGKIMDSFSAPAVAAISKPLPNRWTIAFSGVAIQMMLGTVYAWSVYKKAIISSHQDMGWTSFHVGLTFALTIFFLGLSAALGGRLVDKAGSRAVATLGGVLFGVGTILAGLAHQVGSIWLMWIGYGLVTGIGNGLAYLAPVAVLTRWFPDKKGFITGLAVMGFGLGAAFMSIIGDSLINALGAMQGVYLTFYVSGALFIVGIAIAARKLINPPADYTVAKDRSKPAPPVVSASLSQARGMSQLYILWGVLFLNVAAGIALLSNLANMAKDLHLGAIGMIMMAGAFCNGFGRIFWGGLSEKLGRRNVFLLIFLTQIPLFILLPQVSQWWHFTLICCYIMLCYGGGFGTMPSFTADTFGPKNMGAIYGLVLLAWGVAGGVGPMVMEWNYARTQTFDVALYIAAGLLACGLVLTMMYRKPRLNG